jgi:thymidylate kinase
LDAHTAVIDGPDIYLSSEHFWARAKKGLYDLLYPSPEDWWLHVALHIVLAKKALPEKYRDRIKGCEAPNFDRTHVLQVARAHGLESIIKTILDDPLSVLETESQVRRLRREARYRLRLNAGNALRWIGDQFYWSIGRLLLLRPGLTIAFIGPDGAGKTTMTQAFTRALNAMQIPVRFAEMGPWNHHVLPSIRVLSYFGASPLEGAPLPNGERRIFRKFVTATIKRYAYLAHVFLDGWARYFMRVFPHLCLRRVVVLDRSILDLLTGYYNQPIAPSQTLRKWIVSNSPQADITILLDNDADIIWGRKKEFPRDLIRDSIERYRALAREEDIVVIHTGDAPESVVARFMSANWQKIVRLRRDRSVRALFDRRKE